MEDGQLQSAALEEAAHDGQDACKANSDQADGVQSAASDNGRDDAPRESEDESSEEEESDPHDLDFELGKGKYTCTAVSDSVSAADQAARLTRSKGDVATPALELFHNVLKKKKKKGGGGKAT